VIWCLLHSLIVQAHIEEMVRLVIEDPPDDVEEKWKYKYNNIACELLTSDVNAITEKLAGDENLLNNVYSFLASDRPSNPLMASFFSKLMGLLIARKSDLMLRFLQSKADFVSLLMKHIGTSAIMDLLLRLITCIDNPECRTQCIQWLNDQQLIQKLCALIDSQEDETKHCNASQCLCDIIRISREQMSQLQDKAEDDPLLATLESSEVVGQLLEHILSGEPKESVLVNGIAVLQTLLEFRKLGPEGCQEQMTELDTQRLARGVHTTLQALTPRLTDFHRILLNPPKQHFSHMPTTVGIMEPPLGNTRLQIARLLCLLLATNRPPINAELRQLATMQVLLDLNFQFEWNNFLHQHVEQSIAFILTVPLSSENADQQVPLVEQLLRDLHLVERILQVWEDNQQSQLTVGGHRKGYMGHLTKVVNHIEECRHRENDSLKVQQFWQDLPEDVRKRWDDFVVGPLAELNKQNSADLVSNIRGNALHSSSEDDDADFRDTPFPQDSAMQQLGFNEDEFTESEPRIDVMFTDKISSINFDIPSEDTQSAASMFEQKCSQRMAQFGDFDADEDMWEEKELAFSKDLETRQKSTPQTSLTERGSDDDDSNDSEEDLDSPQKIFQQSGTLAKTPDSGSDEDFTEFVSAPQTDTAMDVTPSSGENVAWAKFDETGKEEKTGNGKNPDGWADFSSFDRMGDANEQRSSSPLSMDTDTARPAAYVIDSNAQELAMEVSESVSPSSQQPGDAVHSSSEKQVMDKEPSLLPDELGIVSPLADKTAEVAGSVSSTENRFISYTEVLKLENEQLGLSNQGQGHGTPNSQGQADSHSLQSAEAQAKSHSTGTDTTVGTAAVTLENGPL